MTTSQLQPRELSELSSVIGELRNFAAQQSMTNVHMLEELKKIGERLANFGEIGATFVEYRKTLHERFNKIHADILDIDERLDKLEHNHQNLDRVVTSWKAQLRSLITVCWIAGTIVSSLLSVYGGVVIKALGQHTP